MEENRTFEQTLEKIHQIIRYLEQNSRSQDIASICIATNELAIHSFYFAEEVSRAHQQMNDAEEVYKGACAKSVSESQESAAKAERHAEVQFAKLKRDFIDWKNLYSRLKLKLDRVDTILDNVKQRISLLKQLDLKNM